MRRLLVFVFLVFTVLLPLSGCGNREDFSVPTGFQGQTSSALTGNIVTVRFGTVLPRTSEVLAQAVSVPPGTLSVCVQSVDSEGNVVPFTGAKLTAVYSNGPETLTVGAGNRADFQLFESAQGVRIDVGTQAPHSALILVFKGDDGNIKPEATVTGISVIKDASGTIDNPDIVTLGGTKVLLSLKPSTVSLFVQGQEQLDALLDGKPVSAFYSSANPAVATVDSNGKVTGVAVGETQIKAALGSFFSATANVTVTAPPQPVVGSNIQVLDTNSIKSYPYFDMDTDVAPSSTVTLPADGKKLTKDTANNQFYISTLTTPTPSIQVVGPADNPTSVTRSLSLAASAQPSGLGINVTSDTLFVAVAPGQINAYDNANGRTDLTTPSRTIKVSGTSGVYEDIVLFDGLIFGGQGFKIDVLDAGRDDATAAPPNGSIDLGIGNFVQGLTFNGQELLVATTNGVLGYTNPQLGAGATQSRNLASGTLTGQVFVFNTDLFVFVFSPTMELRRYPLNANGSDSPTATLSGAITNFGNVFDFLAQ